MTNSRLQVRYQLQRPFYPCRPPAHGVELHRVRLWVQDEMGVADDNELEKRRRQKAAIEQRTRSGLDWHHELTAISNRSGAGLNKSRPVRLDRIQARCCRIESGAAELTLQL